MSTTGVDTRGRRPLHYTQSRLLGAKEVDVNGLPHGKAGAIEVYADPDAAPVFSGRRWRDEPDLGTGSTGATASAESEP